mmetsp:Transcript_14684/g.31335  ORF Transcript_14684/g.31335 Transcript_14684/m.31335 type:complete len:262 (+) Transcript_14684:1622-2407(+)
MQVSKGRGNSQGDSRLSRDGTKTCCLLRGQSTNTSDTQQGSQCGSGRVDFGKLTRHGSGSVQTEGSRRWIHVIVVVFRWIVGSLEHVEHLGGDDESTDNVDGTEGGGSSSQGGSGRTCAVGNQVHSTQSRRSGNGICNGHQWRMKCVCDSHNHLGSNDVREPKGSKHAGKGRVWSDRTQCQDASGKISGILGTVHVNLLVVDFGDRHLFFHLFLDHRWGSRSGRREHELALFDHQHATNGLVVVVNVEAFGHLGGLRPRTQ